MLCATWIGVLGELILGLPALQLELPLSLSLKNLRKPLRLVLIVLAGTDSGVVDPDTAESVLARPGMFSIPPPMMLTLVVDWAAKDVAVYPRGRL